MTMYKFKLQFEHPGSKARTDSGLYAERNCVNVYEYLHDVSILNSKCQTFLTYHLIMFDPHHEFWMSLGIGTINDILDMFGIQTKSDFEIET